MSEQERLIELQQTGALKTGIRDAAAGFESVDFRLTGSVTSYSEIAESFDVLLGQSKTIVARGPGRLRPCGYRDQEEVWWPTRAPGSIRRRPPSFLGIGSGSTS